MGESVLNQEGLSVERLVELRELHSKTSPNEWKAGRMDMVSYEGLSGEPFKNIYTDDERGGFHPKLGERLPYTVARGEGEECLENAQWIEAAHKDFPALLDSAESAASLRAENQRLRKALAGMVERSQAYWDVAGAIGPDLLDQAKEALRTSQDKGNAA